jgi:hypothetical protein
LATIPLTREAWLLFAVNAVAPIFQEKGFGVPRVRVSRIGTYEIHCCGASHLPQRHGAYGAQGQMGACRLSGLSGGPCLNFGVFGSIGQREIKPNKVKSQPLFY